jgi:hypothetical protein
MKGKQQEPDRTINGWVVLGRQEEASRSAPTKSTQKGEKVISHRPVTEEPMSPRTRQVTR